MKDVKDKLLILFIWLMVAALVFLMIFKFKLFFK